MPLSVRHLHALVAHGVPLGALDGLLVTRTADDDALFLHSVLHADPPELTPFTPELPLAAKHRLCACAGCQNGTALESTLRALGALAPALERAEYNLGMSEDDLQPPLSAAKLAFGQDRLRDARAELDSALRPDAVPALRLQMQALPGDAEAWFADWLTRAQTRLTAALAAYADADEVPKLLSAAIRDGKVRRDIDPRIPRYVTVASPHGVLLDRATMTELNGSPKRLIRAILLTHSPVVWLGTGRGARALYRLPGALAAALLDAGGVFTDAGPVAEADTDQVLADAAALFDGAHDDAPLADPGRALSLARDLVAA